MIKVMRGFVRFEGVVFDFTQNFKVLILKELVDQ